MRDVKSGHRMPLVSLEIMRWWYVYRFFDPDGQLLYVGVTSDPHKRWLQHQRRSPWASLADTVSLEWYAYEDLALIAERRAIRDESPRFNVRSTPQGNAQQRAAGRASAHARGIARRISAEQMPRTDGRDGLTQMVVAEVRDVDSSDARVAETPAPTTPIRPDRERA
jgi:predicted GIY-YIG superfamily endonuclease